jgi:Zinc knuckle
MCDKIASMAYVYHATYTYDGKPKVAGYESGNRFVNKTESNGGNKGLVNNQVTNASRVSSETQVKTPFSKPMSASTGITSTNVRCYNCNQLGHTRKLCPHRKVVTSARVQAYTISETPQFETPEVSVTPVTSDSRDGKGVHVQSPIAPNSDNGQRIVNVQAGNSRSTRDVIESRDARTGAVSSEGITAHRSGSSAAGRPADNTSSTRSDAVGPESNETYSSEVASPQTPRYSRGTSNTRIFYPSNADSHTSSNVCSSAVMAEPYLSPQSIADNIVTLKYVKVAIDGVDNNLDALNDSGSQINLTRRSIVPEDKMQTVGRIAIRGAFGAPVQTDVALLSIKPAVSDINEVNIALPLEVMFAVCDELNERIILTSDTVNKLETLQQYNVVHISKSNIAMANTVDDEVDDPNESSEDDVIPLDGSSESLVSTVQNTSIDCTITTSNQPGVDSQMRSADYVTLRNEQLADPSLSKYWDMARDSQKNGFSIQDGLLYHRGQVNGEKVIQLCLPSQILNVSVRFLK